jgi:hypothetical protein
VENTSLVSGQIRRQIQWQIAGWCCSLFLFFSFPFSLSWIVSSTPYLPPYTLILPTLSFLAKHNTLSLPSHSLDLSRSRVSFSFAQLLIGPHTITIMDPRNSPQSALESERILPNQRLPSIMSLPGYTQILKEDYSLPSHKDEPKSGPSISVLIHKKPRDVKPESEERS